MSINEYDRSSGGDDRKILAYALFTGNRYEPGIGVDSLAASADTVEELKNLPIITNRDKFDQWQIIDTTTFKVTDFHNGDEMIISEGIELIGDDL